MGRRRLRIRRLNLKIRVKFFFVLLAVSVLLTLLISGGALMIFRESFTENAAQNVRRSAQQFQGAMERRFSDMHSALFTLAMDKNVQKNLIDNFISDYERYLSVKSTTERMNIISVVHEGLDFYLINRKKGIALASVAVSDALRGAGALERFDWYDELSDGDGLQLIRRFTLDDGDPGRVAVAYRVLTDRYPIGYVVASMEMGFVDQLAREVLDVRSDGALLLMDGGAVLYSSIGALDEGQRAALIHSALTEGESAVVLNDQPYIMGVRRSDEYGFTSVLLFHQTQLNQGLNNFIRALLALVLLVIALATCAGFFIAHGMTRPIRALTKAIDDVEHLSLPARVEPPSNDETGQLAHSINRMLDRMDRLIYDLMQQQELKRLAEIESLSHQINPHFLYNILETIASIAEVYQCPEISALAQRLSKMFRYSLSGGAMDRVAFRMELQHVEDYIFIQRVRFLDRVRLEIEIDEAAMELYTLKFLLQPIVENAVVHGIEGKVEGGRVKIVARVEGDTFCVAIEDDGVGMPAQVLLALSSALKGDPAAGVAGRPHIGLINVHKRIQMAFSSAYGLSIESVWGRGTRVTVRLPRLRGEDV